MLVRDVRLAEARVIEEPTRRIAVRSILTRRLSEGDVHRPKTLKHLWSGPGWPSSSTGGPVSHAIIESDNLEQIVIGSVACLLANSFRSLVPAPPVIAAALMLSMSPLPSLGADPVPMLLSSPVATEASRAAAKSQPAGRSVIRHRPVTINFELLDPKTGSAPAQIGVELFDGVIVILELVRIERRGAGNYTWHGRVRGYEGSEAVLTVVDGEMAGTIALLDVAARTLANYELLSNRDGSQSLRQIDQSGFPPEHPSGGETLHAPRSIR